MSTKPQSRGRRASLCAYTKKNYLLAWTNAHGLITLDFDIHSCRDFDVPVCMDLVCEIMGGQTAGINYNSQVVHQFMITCNPVLCPAACVCGPDGFDKEACC